ncbi:hypothetical protein R3P38DRAFT_3255158 [Favolaschia claudopus]|uniref:F-box domain-containing protein n=1 Tax=Favolaschia claudopus TaxID=2862362 RepID=A0AAW0DGA6_9AGAR
MDLFDIQNPDIYDRLRHNILPSDTEKRAIQDSIEVAKAHIVELESQAPTLSVLFRGVEADIQAWRKHVIQSSVPEHYITQYSSLLSPIRRLPVDILCKIFLDPAIHEPRRVSPSLLPSYYSILHQYKPNRLGAVCYHWRCVTLEMATLWSGITVLLNQPSRYSIDGLRLALQRSQNSLLHIAFRTFQTVTSRGFESGSPLDDEMMLEVLQHTERWAVLDLPLERDFLLQLSPAQGRLDALNTLTGCFSSLQSMQTTIFSTAPQLRTVSIRGWSYRVMLPPLPWSQVTRLCMDSGTDSPALWQSRQILSQAKDDRDLSFRISYAQAAPHVVLPHLDKIILLGPSTVTGHEMEILRRITAPALNQFHVVNLKFWDTPPMLEFIKRSDFSLQTLVFFRVPIRAIDLVPILRAVPTVQTLFLEDLIPNAITNPVMDALTAHPATPAETVLPAMSTFVLAGAYLFGQDNLLTMLESRVTLPDLITPLTDVEISLPKLPIDMSPVALLRLDAIRLATTSFRFAGIDQNRRAVVVKFGGDAPHIASIRDQGLQGRERAREPRPGYHYS